MSNTGNTELDARSNRDVSDILNGPSAVPYSLPAVGNLHRTVSVEQKRKLTRKLMYPRLASKIEKSGFIYEMSSEELAYTQLHELAVTRSSTITTVVREVSKGVEYMKWYSIEKGWDAAGNEVIGSGSYLCTGLDYDIEIKQLKNSEGITTRLQLGTVKKPILTELFDKDKLEALLQNNELDERIQYSFTTNIGQSYGGFTAEEMINCTAKELTSRGQLGKAGTDLTVMYSELTAKDTLFLQSQAPK